MLTLRDLHDVRDCIVCRRYFVVNGIQLIASCAAQATAEGNTAESVVQRYMVAFHKDGHT